MDATSHIACSRLYTNLSYKHFEDLLTEVALPIAQSLNMNPKYLSIFNDSNVMPSSPETFLPTLDLALHDRGFEIDTHIIKVDRMIPEFLSLRTTYTKGYIATLLPLLQTVLPFYQIKAQMQQYIRFINLEQKNSYKGALLTPIEYHNKLTLSKPILPIWAYINRPY